MKHVIPIAGIVLLGPLCAMAQQEQVSTPSPPAAVTLHPACVRNIGGVTEFDRAQFITIHASPWDHDLTPEERRFLRYDLEVSFGRDGGLRSWERSQTREDPKRPGFPDLAHIRERGAAFRKKLAEAGVDPKDCRDMILCTHPELVYPSEGQHHAPWGPHTMAAAAEFTANFMRCFFTDESRPRFIEVVNEPIVSRKKYGGSVEGVAELHRVVAKRVREMCPNVLVGGYTAAYPEFEIRDFAVWNNWMKRFIDLAGRDMDFFSIHIYDHARPGGGVARRTGSNAEALIDVLDAYGSLSFGAPKPLVISEFGLSPKTQKGKSGLPYSPRTAGRMVHTTIAQVMQFMSHPDRIIKVVPFILTKGGWTYNLPGCSEEKPYPFLLWRRKGGRYILTDLALYYKFWKGVKGRWRRSETSAPDILCHLLADGNRLNVVLTSLEDDARVVRIAGLERLPIDRVALRTLETNRDEPLLSERPLAGAPKELTLQPGESALLMVDVREPGQPTRVEYETRHYADRYLQPIEAGKPIRFRFTNLPDDKDALDGRAVLRLSIGRTHGKSLAPVVTLGGEKFPARPDWMGGDQKARKNFFGVIEVPLPWKKLHRETKLQVIFPESGGRVAAAVLQIRRTIEREAGR